MAVKKVIATKTVKRADLKVLLAKAKKSRFPKNIKPMLATLVDEPFDAEGWQYEIKWDGYRAVAYINKGKVVLQSRNLKSFDEKFYPVHDALTGFKKDMVLDGEIIVADKEGMANFGHLQNWRSEADGQLLFYVFDILWYDGLSLMDLTLEDRRVILEAVLPQHDMIRLSENFQASATDFFETAGKMGLEGIMAKKAGSVYTPNDRSRDWLKIKTQTRHEVVIGGFTKNEGSARPFSSLLVGVYKNKKLQYTGKIGTGFSAKMQQEMMQQFKPLISKKSPFIILPDINK
ncbi:MAG: DNA ligase D, partial [Chryseobacterium sp.]